LGKGGAGEVVVSVRGTDLKQVNATVYFHIPVL